MELSSSIQDTTEFFKKIVTIQNIGVCFIVTMDMESVYSNIIHDEGLKGCQHTSSRVSLDPKGEGRSEDS